MHVPFRPLADRDQALFGSLLSAEPDLANAVWEVPDHGVIESMEHVLLASAHLLIRLGKDAQATLCLSLEGEKDARYDVEIMLEAGASLRLLCLQGTDAEGVSVRQRASVEEGAGLTVQNVTVGGSRVSHDIVSTVEGRAGSSSVDWISYARGGERHALSARNVFNGADGGGEILMKGVAQDTAHTKADGLIDIGPGGGGTNTYLTQDVLMLDATAKVDAVPGLEIKTNDVKASHSATVSRVTPEDLFYFAARGIPREEARRMYVLGFLGQITDRISVPAWKERVLRSVEDAYAHFARD